jgi:hypothetical protein
MADFSKEYCELFDPEMPHDFSIIEVAASMEPGYYKSYICEGFGFVAISKSKTGKIDLFVPNYKDNPDSGKWVDYEKFIKQKIKECKTRR